MFVCSPTLTAVLVTPCASLSGRVCYLLILKCDYKRLNARACLANAKVFFWKGSVFYCLLTFILDWNTHEGHDRASPALKGVCHSPWVRSDSFHLEDRDSASTALKCVRAPGSGVTLLFMNAMIGRYQHRNAWATAHMYGVTLPSMKTMMGRVPQPLGPERPFPLVRLRA